MIKPFVRTFGLDDVDGGAQLLRLGLVHLFLKPTVKINNLSLESVFKSLRQPLQLALLVTLAIQFRGLDQRPKILLMHALSSHCLLICVSMSRYWTQPHAEVTSTL